MNDFPQKTLSLPVVGNRAQPISASRDSDTITVQIGGDEGHENPDALPSAG
jgi:hypothetical protein